MNFTTHLGINFELLRQLKISYRTKKLFFLYSELISPVFLSHSLNNYITDSSQSSLIVNRNGLLLPKHRTLLALNNRANKYQDGRFEI
ncbi:hypothetical protein BpHYR1_036244 [Brachionus plicatilis]|uniref:Uncharacterized protein n=1 Tax=Brachionus plicatilis TaxID=10195 RepID=A0A3M7RH01_BRAPC|nr:hypothetical protein BpHYR1_036244 [Brachionus plicatilis]